MKRKNRYCEEALLRVLEINKIRHGEATKALLHGLRKVLYVIPAKAGIQKKHLK